MARTCQASQARRGAGQAWAGQQGRVRPSQARQAWRGEARPSQARPDQPGQAPRAACLAALGPWVAGSRALGRGPWVSGSRALGTGPSNTVSGISGLLGRQLPAQPCLRCVLCICFNWRAQPSSLIATPVSPGRPPTLADFCEYSVEASHAKITAASVDLGERPVVPASSSIASVVSSIQNIKTRRMACFPARMLAQGSVRWCLHPVASLVSSVVYTVSKRSYLLRRPSRNGACSHPAGRE